MMYHKFRSSSCLIVSMLSALVDVFSINKLNRQLSIQLYQKIPRNTNSTDNNRTIEIQSKTITKNTQISTSQMQIAQFLKNITTPQIESASLHSLLQSKHKQKKQGLAKYRGLWYGNSSDQRAVNFTMHCTNNGSLKTMSPYYVDKREKVNNTLHAKCGYHRKIGNQDVQLRGFMKSREGSDSNLQARVKLGQYKRMFQREYQRRTHQPPRTPAVLEPDFNLRKQYAQASYYHKFCTMFRIKCDGHKCKLDCFNQNFQQFLRKSDLCILKGLDRIVGRGMNLDGDIKAEIMNMYADLHHTSSLQNIFSLIREKIMNKLGDNLLRKYLNWAKQIIGIVQKFDKQEKIKKPKTFTKLPPNSSLEYDIKQNQRSFIRYRLNKINKNKYKQKQISLNETIKKNLAQKESENQMTKKQSLVIRGSRTSSIHSMSRKRSTMSHRSMSSGQFFIDYERNDRGKKPSRMKKYSSKNKISKRKIISLIKRDEEKTSKYEPSRFYDGQTSFHTTKRMITEKTIQNFVSENYEEQNNEKKQQQKEKSEKSQTSFSSESDDKVDERFEIFNDLLNKLSTQHKRVYLLEPGQPFQKEEIKNQQENKDTIVAQKQFQIIPRLKKRGDKMRTSKMKEARKSSIMGNFSHFTKRKSQVFNFQQKIDKKVFKADKVVRGKSKKKIKPNFDQNQKLNFLTKKKHQSSQISQKNVLNESSSINRVFQEIQKTTDLMQRVEKDLEQKGLVMTILCKDDSLLTQKRKIRRIRQLAMKGVLDTQSQEIEKYLDIFIKRNKLEKLCQLLSSNRKKQDLVLEKEQIKSWQIDKIIKKTMELKFYNLRVVEKFGTLRSDQEQEQELLVSIENQQNQQGLPSTHEGVSVMLEQMRNKPPPLNMKFLGLIETFSTKKQHKSFDFYHYLQLGDNLNQKKYPQPRSLKPEESKGSKVLCQKKLAQEAENQIPYSKLY